MKKGFKQRLTSFDAPSPVPADFNNDLDLSRAAESFLPGNFSMDDLPDLPIYNRRTGRFRRFLNKSNQNRRRVVSMPILEDVKDLPKLPIENNRCVSMYVDDDNSLDDPIDDLMLSEYYGDDEDGVGVGVGDEADEADDTLAPSNLSLNEVDSLFSKASDHSQDAAAKSILDIVDFYQDSDDDVESVDTNNYIVENDDNINALETVSVADSLFSDSSNDRLAPPILLNNASSIYHSASSSKYASATSFRTKTSNNSSNSLFTKKDLPLPPGNSPNTSSNEDVGSKKSKGVEQTAEQTAEQTINAPVETPSTLPLSPVNQLLQQETPPLNIKKTRKVNKRASATDFSSFKPRPLSFASPELTNNEPKTKARPVSMFTSTRPVSMMSDMSIMSGTSLHDAKSELKARVRQRPFSYALDGGNDYNYTRFLPPVIDRFASNPYQTPMTQPRSRQVTQPVALAPMALAPAPTPTPAPAPMGPAQSLAPAQAPITPMNATFNQRLVSSPRFSSSPTFPETQSQYSASTTTFQRREKPQREIQPSTPNHSVPKHNPHTPHTPQTPRTPMTPQTPSSHYSSPPTPSTPPKVPTKTLPITPTTPETILKPQPSPVRTNIKVLPSKGQLSPPQTPKEEKQKRSIASFLSKERKRFSNRSVSSPSKLYY